MSTTILRITHPDGRTEDRTFSIGSYHLGRDGGDIPLSDPNVSGSHARIDVQAYQTILSDLGSTNGTFDAQGNRIGQGFVLQPNQPVRLGGTTITLVNAQPAAGGTALMPQVGPGPAVGTGFAPPAGSPPMGAAGVPQGAAPVPPQGAALPTVSSTQNDERTFAMLCHLSPLAGYVIPLGNIAGPLTVWLMKKNEYPLVDDQGKESLNFQITVSIAVMICIVLSIFLIGIPFLIAIGVGALVFQIIGAMKAHNGIRYRYPVTIRFIK